MIIGAPKEIKDHEYRVALLPFGVELLVSAGHQVIVQTHAGDGSGATDDDYIRAGATVVSTAKEVFSAADLIVKVKEPQPEEYAMMKAGQTVFTYFHFAASRELTEAIVKTKIVAVAYETIELPNGTLPLLTPMSEVAGRMAIQEGAKYLEKPFKGRGMLLAGVPGVEPAKVVVIGGGVVGTNATKMAAGLGADVTILDVSLPRLRYLDDVMPPNVKTMMSNPWNIRRVIQEADLLVGAVLVTGDKAPVLVTDEMIATMKKGAVFVDVAVDQGGCVETTKPTTHSNPIYIVHDVVHYCVANMPGAVARTSTYALCNATFPYLLQLANKGYKQAALDDRAIALGLNMVEGQIVLREIATLFGLPYTPLEKVLG